MGIRGGILMLVRTCILSVSFKGNISETFIVCVASDRGKVVADYISPLSL